MSWLVFVLQGLSIARLILIGHPAALCGILLSDLLIIIFRGFKLSCFRDLNLRNLRNLWMAICVQILLSVFLMSRKDGEGG